ncbi:hypothetical protein HW537_12120 [Asaia siamensis]
MAENPAYPAVSVSAMRHARLIAVSKKSLCKRKPLCDQGDKVFSSSIDALKQHVTFGYGMKYSEMRDNKRDSGIVRQGEP